jgi:alkylation response protein AidB-like acyl-CoA dehydrogenase
LQAANYNSFAVDESSHHNPTNTEMIAKKEGSNFIVNGKKIFVIDGASADL